MSFMCQQNKLRIVGLDLYRLIAFVLITNIHFFGYSGISNSTNLSVFNNYFVKIATCFDTCFVNMFVLLTGYFLGKKVVKKSKLVDLWFQVLIVGVLLFVICGVISPSLITCTNFVHTLFPITTFTYWYLIPYFFLFVLSPYINGILESIERSKLKRKIMCVGGGTFLCGN